MFCNRSVVVEVVQNHPATQIASYVDQILKKTTKKPKQ